MVDDSYIDELIRNSTLSETQKQFCENFLEHAEFDSQIEPMITYLFNNQRCNIDAGHNYSQTDIQRKLKQL